MPCGLSDPVSCVTGPVLSGLGGDAVSSLASSAWDSICKSFADACTEVLKAFANAFVKIPRSTSPPTGSAASTRYPWGWRAWSLRFSSSAR